MHVYAPGAGQGMLMSGSGATAENFLLPLIIGISILAFILTATLALSPSDQEMQAEAALMQRIEAATAGQPSTVAVPVQAVPVEPGHSASRNGQARRQGDSGDPVWKR
jgi:hypothetical protein